MSDEQIRGIRTTRQGLRVYHSRLDERVDPRGRPYYWIGGDAPTGVPEHGTDVGALVEGFVSVTPSDSDRLLGATTRRHETAGSFLMEEVDVKKQTLNSYLSQSLYYLQSN